MSPRARAVAGYGVAVALVLVGALVGAIAGRSDRSGWFAYSPPLPPADLSSLTAWTYRWIGAVLLVVAGLLTGATTTGWLLGRRPAAGPRGPRPRVALWIAVALVVLGLVVSAVGPRDPGPTTVIISRAPFDVENLRPTWFWAPAQVVGASVVLVGLVLGAGALAWWWSRRLRRPAP
ncbi:hypothetical protein [uncultured Friedmanniella sp.]|uniref:hypothetical protein n=1 Tax=uncultured Friedmanniella sp. TaxID=335381 RepID=UPI0035CA1242